MEKKTEKKVALFILYGGKKPLDFPFIKDEEGRPYYGREGIDFYLRRLRERK